jgi:hypothetical protein
MSSLPQEQLLDAIKGVVGSLYYVEEEYSLGNGQRLDIFVHDLRLGFEYHGPQHFTFVPHFHRTWEGFLSYQERDRKKAVRCRELGIKLFISSYLKSISEERIREIVNASEPAPPEGELVDKRQRLENARMLRRKAYLKQKARKQQREALLRKETHQDAQEERD